MKKSIKTIYCAILAVLLLLSVSSCTDSKWDVYDKRPDYLKNGSLFDVISQNPDYSEFTGLLKKTGYDSLLRRNGLMTVLAVKNGAFSTIDTSSDLQALKKMIGMHIVSSALYPENLVSNQILAQSGKLLLFSTTNNVVTVNNLHLNLPGTEALNGMVYYLDQVIVPHKSLYEEIAANPDLSIFYNYIKNSYISTIDPARNIIVGYDTLNKPIYKTPIVYTYASTYMALTKLDDETSFSTAFLPTNDVVNTVLSRLLDARGGRTNLIVPNIRDAHADTIVGGYYFPAKVKCPGDTAILLDYMFRACIIGKKLDEISGTNSFINVLGTSFSVSSAQLKTPVTTTSNGDYYLLNDITLPDTVYRKTYMYDYAYYKSNGSLTVKTVTDPGDAAVYNGATLPTSSVNAGPATVSSSGGNFYERYATYNFGREGGMVALTIPFVKSGAYKVVLRTSPVGNVGCLMSVKYNNMVLRSNLNMSNQFTQNLFGNVFSVDVPLGTINVDSDGPVTIQFICVGTSPLSDNVLSFTLNNYKLIPVSGL